MNIAQDYNTIEEYWADVALINEGKSQNTYWDTYENGMRRQLESSLAKVYGSESCLFLNSGMSAIHSAIEAQILSTGDVVMVGEKSYFETGNWLDTYLSPRGVRILKVKTENADEVFEVLQKYQPKLCIFETVINSPDVICLDLDNKFFEVSNRTVFIIDNTVQSHLTRWFQIIERRYHDRVLVVESGSKYIAENLMMGIVYGTWIGLEPVRDYARSIGNQLQQRVLEHLNEDFRTIDQKMNLHSKNLSLLSLNINHNLFEFVRTLNQRAINANQKKLFSNGVGCLLFIQLKGKNLKSHHRKLVNQIHHKISESGYVIDIRAGFGYTTTCIRSYEDSGLNQPDNPLYVRISVGCERPEYFVRLARFLNQFAQPGVVLVEAATYIEMIKSMPNEVLLLDTIELVLRKKLAITSPGSVSKILYYCCGPCPILDNNPALQSILTVRAQLCGVDLSDDYITYNKTHYPEHDWICGDAVDCVYHNEVSLLNSSYHHIPPNQKIDFLRRVSSNLASDGIVIMGENFLPLYSDSDSRRQSVQRYYSELLSDNHLSADAKLLLQNAQHNDTNLSGEYKNHIWEFLDQIESVGLQLVKIHRIWPVVEYFDYTVVTDGRSNIRGDFYGSCVLVLSNNYNHTTKNLS
jgi:cystathionine beta-lyase/cystathionine gamma-synthase